MQQRVITSTPSVKNALIADMFAIVPLGGGKDKGGKKDARRRFPRVPDDAKEIAFMEIGAAAGLDFAKLTGDFNPIHWIPAAARAAGFPNVILHGFGTMARTLEALNRGVFGGDPTQAQEVELPLHAAPGAAGGQASVFVRGNEVFVGVAPGGAAYLVGSFET